jgi:1,4-dihydroxy-2-naphthoate polyprenyltransferase
MKTWLLAARPKTLPAAIAPVWVGSVLAYSLTGNWSPGLAVCALISALLIQIATNLFNDALDFRKGADTPERLGPRRVTSSGLVPQEKVIRLGIISLAAACLVALPLIAARGWPMLAIGLPSLYFAFGYTGGPWPLAYRGLGELFVLIFFGLVAVSGTVFVNTGRWFWPESMLAGTQVGMLSTVLIAINNLRDVAEDFRSTKRTLAVRFGTTAARIEISLLCLLPPLLGLALWHDARLSRWPLATLPLGAFIACRVWLTPPSAGYNKLLAAGGIQLLLFAIFFTLGALF